MPRLRQVLHGNQLGDASLQTVPKYKKHLPITNRVRGLYWGILARGRDSTDQAQYVSS